MPKEQKRMKVSDHIRAALESGEVSRYRVSQDTSVEQSALSRFLSGERGLSMEAIDTLAEYFGLEIVIKRKK